MAGLNPGMDGSASVFEQHRGLMAQMNPQAGAMAAAGLHHLLPGGGGAQPAAAQQQQHDSSHRLSQMLAAYQQEQQVAALLQQANSGMGAGGLSLAQALAASGLLGGLQGLAPPQPPPQPAPLAGLPGLAGMGQLQGLGGGLGELDLLGLRALQQVQQASQGLGQGLGPGLGLGMGQLQALHSLGALGPAPGGGGGFGAPPQLSLGSLQAATQQQQQQQQQMAAGQGPGYGVQQAGKQLDQELLQQLQQLNDANLARLHGPGLVAAPAAARAASAAPLPPQQQPAMPSQQESAIDAAVRQRQLEFEALLFQQQQAQQAQQQPQPQQAAPPQPSPSPAAVGPRPQRRRLPSGKAAATEASQLPHTATATLALAGAGAPPLLHQPSVASVSLQQPATGRGSRGGAIAADFLDYSPEEAGEGQGGESRDDRLAEARRKNREAQQRFRERQRAAVREAEAKYQEMLDQVCQLRLENEELVQRNYCMSAALAVRDSMLQAFQLGQRGSTPSQSEGAGPSTAQAQQPLQQQQPQEQHSDAQPSGQPLEQQEETRGGSTAAAAEEEAAQNGVEAPSAAAGAEAAPDGGEAPRAAASAAAGGAADGAATPSGSAAHTSCGRSSTEIEEVQPASHGALAEPLTLKTARLMRTPEDLCTYYRQAQVEMRFALQVYLENGQTEEDRRAVEAAHQLMQDVWAHTMALFPEGVKRFIHDLSCPEGLHTDRWEALAAKLVFSDESLQELFTGYRRYLKQNARIAQERQHLQQQLARLLGSLAAPVQNEEWALGMHAQGQAAAMLEALDVAQGLDHLADQEFHSRMDFCLPWCSSVGQFQMALVNAESTPYIPQFLELARRVLRIAAESGRLVGNNGLMLTPGEAEVAAAGGGAAGPGFVHFEEQEEEEQTEAAQEGAKEEQPQETETSTDGPGLNGARLGAGSVGRAGKGAAAGGGQAAVPVAAPAATNQ